jgi:hypothetical protein
MMKLIIVPRLRLTLLQTLTEATIKICKNIFSLSASLVLVEDALNSFKKGMVKDPASAKGKKRLDYHRDEYVTGFMGNVQSEQKFPHQDLALLKVLAELLEVVKKYGLNIKRLRVDQETAAIDNMMADIADLDITPLEPTGLTRWIPVVEQANADYKEAASDFISDTTESANTLAATLQAPQLEDTLEGFYAMAFAQLKMSPTEELSKAYAELETLVDSMK